MEGINNIKAINVGILIAPRIYIFRRGGMIVNIKTLSSAGYNMWSEICTGTTNSGIGGGYIDVEPGFQLISTPVIHGWWNSDIHMHVHDGSTVATVYNYIVTQIEDVYSVPANTMVEVFNTLIGGNGIYWNFVPGVTNPLSPHAFQLGYYDPGAGGYEYTGFFIKSIHPVTFQIRWGEI